METLRGAKIIDKSPDDMMADIDNIVDSLEDLDTTSIEFKKSMEAKAALAKIKERELRQFDHKDLAALRTKYRIQRDNLEKAYDIIGRMPEALTLHFKNLAALTTPLIKNFPEERNKAVVLFKSIKREIDLLKDLSETVSIAKREQNESSLLITKLCNNKLDTI